MRILNSIADYLLAALIMPLLALFRVLPFATSSAIGGAVARRIGPHLRVSARAKKNLRFIYPDWDDARIAATVRDMWDNLGRNFAEFNALDRIDWDRDVTLSGQEHYEAACASGRPIIYLVMHLGNWEVLPHHLACTQNPVTVVYRAANNRVMDRVIQSIRRRTGLSFAPKGRAASKAMVAALSARGGVVLLLDQKMGDGELLPFMGQPALTGTGWARLVLRYNALVLPSITTRHGHELRIHYDVAWDLANLHLSADPAQAARELSGRANDLYGQWIHQHPGQWLWVHQRWGRLV